MARPSRVRNDLEPIVLNMVNAARYIGVSPTRFYELVNQELIRTYPNGNRRVVPVAELRRYVDEQMANAGIGGDRHD